MAILWNNETAACTTGGHAQGRWQASRVVIDSRSVRSGDLFVAIKGERFDGHDFVQDALARGAAAAVVSHPSCKGNFLVVPDTLKALEALGIYNRHRSTAKVVGVTGSVGKTSTKDMLRLALSAQGVTYATSGNYNNHIGTPLNLANLPPDAAFAVFEMGMNHSGEIAHLTRMVQPDIAIITTIEAVHLEFFASIEAIADAKAEIFAGMAPGSTILLNADNAQAERLARAAKNNGLHPRRFGSDAAHADDVLLDYQPAPGGATVSARIGGTVQHYRLGATGRHFALLSVAVLAVVQALGGNVAEAAARLADFHEAEGRGAAFALTSPCALTLIDDSYNASPASMKAAFAKTLELWEQGGRKGRKLAALGDMLELGQAAPLLHAELGDALAAFDLVFTAGPLMQHLSAALPPAQRGGHAADAQGLLPLLWKSVQDGDIVLVKGSHGSKMYMLAQALVNPATKEQRHAL